MPILRPYIQTDCDVTLVFLLVPGPYDPSYIYIYIHIHMLLTVHTYRHVTGSPRILPIRPKAKILKLPRCQMDVSPSFGALKAPRITTG